MEIEGCELPEDRYFDLENDVWLQPEAAGGGARIGLASWLGAFAGRFHRISFRPLEGPQPRGRSVATVESIRFTGAVRLPVDAEVVERNAALLGRPRLLNDRPYDEGWVVRVAMADPHAPERGMERAPALSDRLRERIRRLRIRCYPASPDAEMFEIGAECQAVLVRLNEELARLHPEEVVLLVTDDPTAPIELVRWEDQTGHHVIHHRREGTLHHFLIRKDPNPVPRRRGP
jgi:glycine cleavage system H protein